MHRDELLNLLTDSEREIARRNRAKTTIRPIDTTMTPVVEDVTTPIEDEPFCIDTRELDARVFQKHALNLRRPSGSIRLPPSPAGSGAIGTAQPVPLLQAPIEVAPVVVPEVAPLAHRRGIPLYVSMLAVVFVLLLVAIGQ